MESVIDPKAIDELRSLNPGDDSFLRDLIQIFIEDSPQQIAEIELSLKEGDATRLTRSAHSLKGSCSNFGAGQLRAVSEKIERLGRSGALGDVAAELPLVKAEFERVKTALQELVSKG